MNLRARVGDRIDAFGVWRGSGTAGTFGAAGTVSGVAIGKIIALLGGRNFVVAVIPLAEVGRLVSGISRLKHAECSTACGTSRSSSLGPRYIRDEPESDRLAGRGVSGSKKLRARSLSESHTHRRQAFDLWRAKIIAASAGVTGDDLQRRSHPTLIIGQDDDEIRFVGGMRKRRDANPYPDRRIRRLGRGHWSSVLFMVPAFMFFWFVPLGLRLLERNKRTPLHPGPIASISLKNDAALAVRPPTEGIHTEPDVGDILTVELLRKLLNARHGAQRWHPVEKRANAYSIHTPALISRSKRSPRSVAHSLLFKQIRHAVRDVWVVAQKIVLFASVKRLPSFAKRSIFGVRMCASFAP